MQLEIPYLEKKRFRKSKLLTFNIVIKILAILIPLLQVVPTTYNDALCLCTFSMPLFVYFYRFNLSMIQADFYHFFYYHGNSFIILGIILLIISLLYKLYNRNKLEKRGPYKYFKHPHYIAVCFITLGLTIKSINTRLIFYPFRVSVPYNLHNLPILILWLTQVLFYVILAKIENFTSKRRFGVYYLEYTKEIKLNWEYLLQIKRKYLKLFVLLLPIYACFLIESLNIIAFLIRIFNLG